MSSHPDEVAGQLSVGGGGRGGTEGAGGRDGGEEGQEEEERRHVQVPDPDNFVQEHFFQGKKQQGKGLQHRLPQVALRATQLRGFTSHRSVVQHKLSQVCEIEGFASEFAVMAHLRKVHGPKEQLTCEEESCGGRTFKNIGALTYHKEKCHTEKAPCAVCGTTDYSILKNHMVSKHPRPCEPKACDQCGKVFTNKVSFKNHIKKGHTGADIVGSTMWGKAKLLSDYDKNCQCGLNLPTYIAKINHYKLFHLEYEKCDKCEKIVQSITDGHHKCSKPVKKPLTAPIVCNYCGKDFNSEGGIAYHVKTVHLKVSSVLSGNDL